MKSGNVIEVPNDVENFFQDISKAASKKPEKQKQYLNYLYDLYANVFPYIQGLNIDRDRLADTLQSLMHQMPKKVGVGLMFTSMIGAATAAQEVVINSGIAPGGTNLCDGMINCIQGYLSDPTNNKVLVAFNAFVEILNNCGKNCNNGGAGLLWAFNEGMKIPNLGATVRDIYLQNSTLDVVSACTATINRFGSNIGSQVQKLTVEQCAAYKTAFEADIQRILPESKVIEYNWAIAGIVLASVLICACMCAGAYCTYKACKK